MKNIFPNYNSISLDVACLKSYREYRQVHSNEKSYPNFLDEVS